MRPTARTRRIALAAGVVALGVHASPAGAAIGGGVPLTIDSFATNQSALTLTFPPAGTDASSSVSGAGILGGERDLQLALSAGVIAGNTASAAVSSGFFSYSQDATISASARLTWDGTDGSPTINPTGLGGVDLTAGGSQDALDLSTVFDDLPITASVTVFTDTTHVSIATVGLPGLVFSNSHFVVPFSSFAPLFGEGADLTNVGAIHVTVGSTVTAPDLVLDELTTDALLRAPMTVALTGDANDDGFAEAGDELTYTTTVENPVDAIGAASPGTTFAFDPPAGTTLVGGSVATSQGTVTSGNGSGETAAAVAVGTVADGGAATVTAKVKIGVDAASLLSAQATIGSDSLTALKSDDPDVDGREDPTTFAVVESPPVVVPPVDEPVTERPQSPEPGPLPAPPAAAPVAAAPKAVCISRRTLRVLLPRANRRATHATVSIAGYRTRRVPVRGGRVAVDLRGAPRSKYTVRVRVGKRTVTTRYYKTCRRPSESSRG